MAAERLFRLEEAQALLESDVRALAERMVERRASTRDLERRWRSLVIAIGSNGGGLDRGEMLTLRNELEEGHRAIKEAVEAITELGVQVKDIDRGLIDFPSRVGGEDALLCWMVGEERIGWWHSREDGFAGRRPL